MRGQSEAPQLLEMPGKAMLCVTAAGKQVFNLDSPQFVWEVFKYVWNATGLLLNSMLQIRQKELSSHASKISILTTSFSPSTVENNI